jgi:hypothetical protein
VPGSSKYFLSLWFPHQNPVYTATLLLRATSPAHLMLVGLILRTVLGEEYIIPMLIIIMDITVIQKFLEVWHL